MLLKTKLLAASAVAVATLGMAAQANATIFIGYSVPGPTPITTVVTDPSNTGTGAGFSVAPFTLNLVTSNSGVLPDIFDSQSTDQITSSGSGTITVYASITDLTAPVGTQPLLSSLTENSIPAGWSVVESTYLGATNSAYDLGTLLGTKTFTALGTSVELSSPVTLTAPYSLTHVYQVTAPGAGSALSTIKISAVPEVSTWALMLLGFGGLGAVMRRQRSAQALANI